MISVATYDRGPSLAPEIASETILESFKIVAERTDWNFSCIPIINEDFSENLMLQSEHISTPSKQIKDEAIIKLTNLFQDMVYALEDYENLYQFSAFEEFLINEVLEQASEKTEKGEVKWVPPGTYISRQKLLWESVRRAEKLNNAFGESYDPIEYARSVCRSLTEPSALTKEADGFMIFVHDKDSVNSWDPVKTEVPRFEAAVKSVKKAEKQSLLSDEQKNKKKEKHSGTARIIEMSELTN